MTPATRSRRSPIRRPSRRRVPGECRRRACARGRARRGARADQGLSARRPRAAGAARDRLRAAARRDRVGGRRLGRGQVDAAARARHARRAVGAGRITFDGVDLDVTTMSSATPGGVSQPRDRLRLPVPPPAARVHGARERDDAGAHHAAAAPRVRRAVARDADAPGPGRSAGPPPGRAVGRRAAAGGAGARAAAVAAPAAGRRADRQPRHQDRARDARRCSSS